MRRLSVLLSGLLVIPTLALTSGQPTSAGTSVRCGGEIATIVGGPRDQQIFGTRGNDVIAGRGGVDAINGRGGDDLICGGRGNDLLDGGKGRDPLYGGPGDHDFCFASREREHRLHRGCEEHVTEPPPPPPPGRSPAAALPSAERGHLDPFHTYSTPACTFGRADFGTLTTSGIGGRVAVGLWYSRFTNNGWSPWRVWTGGDGWTYYNVGFGTIDIDAGVATPDSGYWLFGWYWYWQNANGQWVTWDWQQIDRYEYGGTGGLQQGWCST